MTYAAFRSSSTAPYRRYDAIASDYPACKIKGWFTRSSLSLCIFLLPPPLSKTNKKERKVRAGETDTDGNNAQVIIRRPKKSSPLQSPKANDVQVSDTSMYTYKYYLCTCKGTVNACVSLALDR